MLTDQHCFWPEGSVSYANGQAPLQTPPEFVRTLRDRSPADHDG